MFIKEKTFVTQIKALTKGEQADPQFIWKSFEGPKAEDDTEYFCFQLFDNFTHPERKNVLQNQERLYATYLFMQLYKNKKKKKPELLAQCREFLEKMQPSHGKTFLQFLFDSERQAHYAQFFINRLLSAPLQIDWQESIHSQFQNQIQLADQYLKSRHKQSHSHKNHQALKYQSYPKYSFPETKLLTFGYICFVDYLKKNGNCIKQSEHQHMNNILKYLVNAVEKNSVAEELIPLAMHLVMKTVTFYGCDEENLKGYLSWAERLRCFTGLIGKMAIQMFDMLYQQLRMPGSAFRKKLRKDFQSLSIKENTFVSKQFFLVTDQEEIYNRAEDLSLITLRKLFIVQAIKTSKVESSEKQAYVQFLKMLNQKQTYVLYDKMTKILDVVAKLESKNKIETILAQYINKLMKQTMHRIQIENVQSQKSNPSLKKKKESQIQAEQFLSFMRKGNKMGYFPYPNFEIISVSITDFISNKESAYNLERIIQKSKADFKTSGFFKNKISIAFLGSGYSFLKFVRVISKYLEQTSLEEAKQIQIYYIPKHDNICRPGVGLYISRKDAWYRRFVFNIHYQKILYPHIELNKANKDLFPFYLYSRNLQLYLREASYSLPIRIYRCILKMAEQDQQQTVYMSSYFSMGIFCEARIIKMQKQKQRSKEEKQYSKQLTEIIHEKLKKFQPMNVSLDVQIIDNLSEVVTHQKQKNILIEDLQICNLPCEYFMGKQPNPSSPLLQMTILTEGNAKAFKKQIENKNFDEVQQAFKQLFLCRTIKSITIQNMDKNNHLRIMVDGNFANKIEKIRIQPAISVSGVPVALQMQCFLPV